MHHFGDPEIMCENGPDSENSVNIHRFMEAKLRRVLGRATGIHIDVFGPPEPFNLASLPRHMPVLGGQQEGIQQHRFCSPDNENSVNMHRFRTLRHDQIGPDRPRKQLN